MRMPADALSAPAALVASRHALDALDDAARLLRSAAVRLTGLAARASAVTTAAEWSAPSARAFGERAERLRHGLVADEADADEIVHDLARVRAALVAGGAGS